jgi:hypothetical protein
VDVGGGATPDEEGMPISFREDSGCAVLELRDTYTAVEAHQVLVHGLATFHDGPPRGLIVDVSQSAMLANRPTPDIVRAAHGLGVLGDRFSRRMGIVAPSTLAFGLMRMGGFHAEHAGLAVRVCQTYESARNWVLRSGGTAEAD